MDWLKLHLNTPGSPKIRRIRRRCGKEGCWSLVCLWCWTAEHGKGDVGRAVDGNGKPYDRETLMEVAELSPKKFDELMEACAETDHIDREAWEQRGELFFPGAMERASEYTRKKVRRSGADSPSPPAGDSPDTDRILTGHSPETDGDCPTGTSDHAEDCPARSDQIREEEIRSDQIRREKRTRAPTSPASPRLRPPSKSLSKRWRTGTS